MILTGTTQMLDTFSGNKTIGGVIRPIIPQSRPPPGPNNAIICVNPAGLSESNLKKLPFWFFGAYQSLFFGKKYASRLFVMKYLHSLFEYTLGEEYAGRNPQTIENIMEYLQAQPVPHANEYQNQPWSAKDADGNNVESLLEVIMLDYEKDQVVNLHFKKFPFTKRSVPYNFLWKRDADENNNFSKTFSLSLNSYFYYFSFVFQFFLDAEAKKLKSVQAFVDVDSKTILNLNKEQINPDDATTLLYANNPTFQRCRPTVQSLHLGIFSFGSSKNNTGIVDQENYLVNNIVYDTSHPLGKLPSTLDIVKNMKILIKRNKMEIIATLLKEVEVPAEPAKEKKAFEEILEEIKDYSRSDRFMLIFILLNAEY